MEGGYIVSHRVRRDPKKNIRVWMSDGSDDIENFAGSWPLNNIELANSLKMREYDFHFSYGVGAHNGHHGNAELPDELKWLWRGYDPGKTEQAYEMEPAEKHRISHRARAFEKLVGALRG